MRSLLKEFVVWMEAAYEDGPLGSEFERPVRAATVRWAEAAVELAVTSRRPMVLFTRGVPAQSVVGSLALHSAGIEHGSVYRGDVSDVAFDKITGYLARVKVANIVFEPGPLPNRDHVAAAMVAGKFVLVC